MDAHRSDASVLNLEGRLTNDNEKPCHIDVDQHEINVKDLAISIKASNEMDGKKAEKLSKKYLLFKNLKVEDGYLLVDQKNGDDHNTKINRIEKIVQNKKISHLGSKLKQILNSIEMLWIYLLLFIMSIIFGYCVLLAFSITNIVGIDQLKQVKDISTKDNRFANKSNFKGNFRVTTGIDSHVFKNSSTVKLNTHQNISWEPNGFTVAGNNTIGNQTNQLSDPVSLFIDDDDQTIYVADTENHRIMEWKFYATSGKMVAGTGDWGNETNQLNWPTSVIIDKEKSNLIICDMNNERIVQWSRQNGTNGQIIISNIHCYALAIDNNGDFYVADWKKNEVRRWKINENYGTLVAGGNGEGNHLDQLRFPSFIFVDEVRSVYVSDWYNNRVMKWLEGAKEGIVAISRQKDWNDPTRLSCPWGLFVDHLGIIYVVDQCHNRIMRWYNGTTQGNIIGGDGKDCGEQANQLCRPNGLTLDRHGNLYVADSYNCRIQRFNINQI